jgi:uncharacterized membrane protein YozB (DUF420 family)
MVTSTMGGFSARPRADRNAFLILTALVWVAVVSGFGTDSFRHVSKHGLDYPLIVHFHAVVFVGFLALFTTQVVLIRTGHVAAHRRLGVAGAALAAVMLVLGPATALIVDAQAYVTRGQTPEFLAVQFTDILAFAGLAGAGLMLRGTSSAHRRLMLLALMYISDAGFARLINTLVAKPFGDGVLGDITGLYFGSDLLTLGLGVYDLVWNRRLHPAWLLGVAWALSLQASAIFLLHNPAWKALSLRLIGH